MIGGEEVNLSQESIEDRVTSLEYSMHSISTDMEMIAKQQSTLNESFTTITELLVRQARAEEQAVQTHDDTLKNKKDIERIQKEGTSVCAVHQKENEAVLETLKNLDHRLDKSFSFRDKIMLSIALLFASGIVGLFFKVFENGVF